MNEYKKFWRRYKGALIPLSAPQESVNISVINRRLLITEKILFARWTSEFDCKYKTEWYYCLADQFIDISMLKAKRRYEINKGLKNFNCQLIDVVKNIDDIYNITVTACSQYGVGNTITYDKQTFKKFFSNKNMKDIVCVGAYSKDSNKLCGYAILHIGDRNVDLYSQKALPEFERKGINAAIVYFCSYYTFRILKKEYLIDGERSIVHQTNFQDYLEKYFGFRKAYCKLNILYNPFLEIIIKIIYPFRRAFKYFSKIEIMYLVYCLLKQEEIRRSFK